jgi:hypothetical protein
MPPNLPGLAVVWRTASLFGRKTDFQPLNLVANDTDPQRLAVVKPHRYAEMPAKPVSKDLAYALLLGEPPLGREE